MYFSTVLAQVGNPVITNGENVDGIAFFTTFVARLIGIIFVVGAIAFFFMFLLGAVRWITSGGDKGQVESARAQITQALTGLIVMFSIWAIATLLEEVLGFNILSLDVAGLLPQ